MDDLIEDFVDWTSEMASPPLFRLWGGIGMVAAALERRVYVRTRFGTAWPNLYVMLVAPPATGKYVIEIVKELLQEACEPGLASPAFRVASSSVTKASMIDELVKAKKIIIPPSGPPYEYHSLAICAEEFGVLMPGYDLEFISNLNDIWNNKKTYTESRRTGTVKSVDVKHPQINILAGVQPGWMSEVFPEVAWSTGLASRLLMVYQAETPLMELFGEDVDLSPGRSRILGGLARVSKMFGEMIWSDEAATLVGSWHRAGGPPRPDHSKLEHYKKRRTLYVCKLSLISAAAAGRMCILKEDSERAMAWLIEIEQLMPDIFRALVGKSDIQVLEELHFFCMGLFTQSKGKPLQEEMLYSFLAQRVPTEKIAKLLETADRMNLVQKEAGLSTWIPKAKKSKIVE